MTNMTRVRVLSETLYDERATLSGWIEWLEERFEQVPEEYRNIAILKIDSVGGYEGDHSVEATLYYDRPETSEEAQHRKEYALARANEAEELARRWQSDAARFRKEAMGEHG